MSLLSLVMGRRGASGFGFASTAEEVTAGVDLRGRTVLVTGVNSGLGLETARVLALRGARIVGLARSREKAAEALAPFGPDHAAVACELSEPATVRAAVEAVKGLGVTLDAMILNAGIMALPERTLKHGQELQFLTNHVGHFILATGLLDRVGERGRVVVLSSSAHRQAPSAGIVFDDLTLAHRVGRLRSVEAGQPALRALARGALRGHGSHGERGPPRRDRDQPRSPHVAADAPRGAHRERAGLQDRARRRGHAVLGGRAPRGGRRARRVPRRLQPGHVERQRA
jgi:hypothetical protein